MYEPQLGCDRPCLNRDIGEEFTGTLPVWQKAVVKASGRATIVMLHDTMRYIPFKKSHRNGFVYAKQAFLHDFMARLVNSCQSKPQYAKVFVKIIKTLWTESWKLGYSIEYRDHEFIRIQARKLFEILNCSDKPGLSKERKFLIKMVK